MCLKVVISKQILSIIEGCILLSWKIKKKKKEHNAKKKLVSHYFKALK